MPTSKIELYDGKGFVELLDSMGDQYTIVEAARVSYNKRTKGDEADERLLHFLFRHKHHSVLEHVVYRFRIRVPIYVARQHMRHRVGWSYNELSRRYTSDEPDALYRDQDIEQPTDNLGYHIVMDSALSFYSTLVHNGVSSERARDILPMATMTEYVTTVNLRALLHFDELRSSPHAQAEIREFANAMYALAIHERDNMDWVDSAYGLYGLGGLDSVIAQLWRIEMRTGEQVAAFLYSELGKDYLVEPVLRDLGFPT